MKPIIFARIADMKYYKGITENDKPGTNFSFVKETGYAHDCNNFNPISFPDDSVVCLGFCQINGNKDGVPNSIHLERMYGCNKYEKSDVVNDAIVIFYSNNTVSSRVVGFYTNATVYRHEQKCMVNHNGVLEEQKYNFSASKEHCTLLPYSERATGDWVIPSSANSHYSFGAGEYGIWYGGDYLNNNDSKVFIEKMIKQIENYKGGNWIDKKDDSNISFVKLNSNNTEKDQHERFVNKYIDEIDDFNHITGEDGIALQKYRVNQGYFRELLLKKYSCCCLCKFDVKALLIASHIMPWHKCIDEKNDRVNPNNGLLLCPNHDKLFDAGYITFEDDGKIVISSELDSVARGLMLVDSSMNIGININRNKFMSYHREHEFEKFKKK